MKKRVLSVIEIGPAAICAGMILTTTAIMLINTQTREAFANDLSAYPWVLAPYAAVGIVSYFTRKNRIAWACGLLATGGATLLSVMQLFPYFLSAGDNTGRGMAAGIIPMVQWSMIGTIAAIGLVALLIQKLVGVLMRKFGHHQP